jgi:hypothetical protein
VRTRRLAVPYKVLYLRRNLTTKTLTLLVLSYTLDGLRSWGITRVALSSYLVLLHWTVCGLRSYLYRFLPLRKTHDLNYLPSRFLLHETLRFERPLRLIPPTSTKTLRFGRPPKSIYLRFDSYLTSTSTSTSYLPLHPTSSTSNSTNPTYIPGRLVILGNTDVPGRVTDRLQSV